MRTGMEVMEFSISPHDTIIINKTMKAIPGFGIVIILIIALITALALANFNPPPASAEGLTGAAFAAQAVTPTTVTEDASEVGSTNGILIMGGVIVLIVTLPLIFRKRIHN